jgi:hypothetical protein
MRSLADSTLEIAVTHAKVMTPAECELHRAFIEMCMRVANGEDNYHVFPRGVQATLATLKELCPSVYAAPVAQNTYTPRAVNPHTAQASLPKSTNFYLWCAAAAFVWLMWAILGG